jgi:Tfp pilus assembly protein PilN
MDGSAKTTFFTSLFRCVGITVITLIICHLILSSMINFQMEKNLQHHLLISEKMFDILEYEKRQKKIVYSEARLNFITTLRRQNSEAANILKELNKTVPAAIEFSEVKWQNRIIWIKGYTHSDLELMDWIDALRKSSVLSAPVITSIGDREQRRFFELKTGIK